MPHNVSHVCVAAPSPTRASGRCGRAARRSSAKPEPFASSADAHTRCYVTFRHSSLIIRPNADLIHLNNMVAWLGGKFMESRARIKYLHVNFGLETSSAYGRRSTYRKAAISLSGSYIFNERCNILFPRKVHWSLVCGKHTSFINMPLPPFFHHDLQFQESHENLVNGR